jgi:hypothetical protein
MRQEVENDPLLLKNHPDPGGGKIDLVVCTAKKKAETIGFACAETNSRADAYLATNVRCTHAPLSRRHFAWWRSPI